VDTSIKAKTPLLADHPAFDTKKVSVLLWSQQQGHLHIESLDAMLASHMRAFVEDRSLQYIPLLIGDRPVIDNLVDVLRPKVAERYNAKHAHEEAFIPYEALP